jgi:hydrogenase expression/formation protein HypE
MIWSIAGENQKLRLPEGKIPVDVLEEVIFKNLGAERGEVVLGPSAGFDGAVIEIGNKSLIVSMDPITGAIERIGWLAVNINANDVATFGIEPAFILSCILLPENADRETVETISVQMNKAAKRLQIAIVGGHCEVTPGLTNPIVIGCTMGIAEKGNYVTAGGAKPGDKLIMTKNAGIEGTAILSTDREQQLKKALNPIILRNAKKFYDKISVVEDALTSFKAGGVHAMHDPTEGGVAGGIHEMADASVLGFKIFEEKIPIAKETLEICRFFQIDPLCLIASGSLLISADKHFADKIVEALAKKEIPASIIGEFLPTPEKRLMKRKDGSMDELTRPTSDHLWLALEKSSSLIQ